MGGGIVIYATDSKYLNSNLNKDIHVCIYKGLLICDSFKQIFTINNQNVYNVDVTCHFTHNSLKAVDTFGNCQTPVVSLGVSQHNLCIK